MRETAATERDVKLGRCNAAQKAAKAKVERVVVMVGDQPIRTIVNQLIAGSKGCVVIGDNTASGRLVTNANNLIALGIAFVEGNEYEAKFPHVKVDSGLVKTTSSKTKTVEVPESKKIMEMVTLDAISNG